MDKEFLEFGYADENTKKLFPKLTQIGIVVPDLEEAMQQIRDIFGLEPDFINVHSPSGYGPKTNYGEPSDYYHRIVLYHLDNIDLELVEPHGDKNASKDFLEAHGKSVNHLAFSTGDFEGVKKHFAELNVPVAMTGPMSKSPKAEFAYFDTTDRLGFMLEIENCIEKGVE